MEFLGKYRGAALFKDIKYLETSDKHMPQKKVISEGVHPEINNLKVELSSFGDSWQEAEKNVAQQIDQYLDMHNIEEFNFDELDLNE
ncbi:MAG TPA: hypothetical protein VFM80_11210 [Gracilimonas sp.]|uniref:hypothetical protein n=1 Tax=Gracilimonas sp. TaxID=1974203 RepID=UPI002D881EFE|nr:hypothetical protein [Gracilimonas sp.]